MTRNAQRMARNRTVALIAGLGVGALAVAAASVAAFITVYFARTVITPPRKRAEDVRILSVGPATITLSATQDSLTPGEYSLWFRQDAGHARVGEIIEYSSESVTRVLLGVDFGDLSTARSGRFSGWFYLSPSELHVPWEDVEIPTELGPAPAWLVPAETPTDRWVVQVHGRAVRRQETLRAIPVFRAAGYSSLLISYRNDGDAPESADHRYALGDTEWRDVESAVQFALDRGAREVVLMGWSMGGATVLQFLTRSELAAVVIAVVLDSPVVDWVTALTFQAELNRLPPVVREGVFALLSQRWAGSITGQAAPIDLMRLDLVRRASELSVPILILHSDDDGFVPSTASAALAAARPDIVTYERFVTARHTKLWNYDRPRWESTIAAWLRRFASPSE
jgi:alpha-beta hydrolase superfamily lysophospholipase